MNRTLVKQALEDNLLAERIRIQGWIRTRRDAKSFSFLELNDGSCLKNLQVVVDAGLPDYRRLPEATTGAAVAVEGRLVESQGKGQSREVVADSLEIVGVADQTYPLQKKGHTQEYLRTIAHLRPRTNLFGSVFRVRSRLAQAVHRFFLGRDFVLIHSPIITANDCEGAGELFQVTTRGTPASPAGSDRNFFGQPTYLTVSGQLSAEAFACALSNVYTFGPTFRAENSNTSRHANEFWMIEPEMAFCDLAGNMDLAESFVKYLIQDIRTHCPQELELFQRFVDRELASRLDFVLGNPFKRLSYAEAVAILQRSGKNFQFPVEYGVNLQSEHERYLTEEHFRQPVTVHDYPRDSKPFYMRTNDDGRTVAAMDVLVPGIGELVGGSQREEREDVLRSQFERHGLDSQKYRWYLELRRYGTVPHSGFGLGFERLVMFVTGLANIRDVIPFARTPGSAEF